MRYDSGNLAVCDFSDVRDAAIYFAKVMPRVIHYLSKKESHVAGFDGTFEDFAKEFFPNELARDTKSFEAYERYLNIDQIIMDAWDYEAISDWVKQQRAYTKKVLNELCAKLDAVNLITSSSFESANSAPTDTVSVTLMKLKLVDTSKATWAQIIELRRDPECAQRLRAFRTAFFKDYIGKPRSFIVDDLARRQDEYLMASRKLGFECKLCAISALLD